MIPRFLCRLGIHSWVLEGERLFGVKYPLLIQLFRCKDCGAEKAKRTAIVEGVGLAMGQMDVARAKAMIHYREINFVEATQNDKDDFWICQYAKAGTEVGRVKWYGPLRQYCFFPTTNVWLGYSQVENIATFLEEKNREHAERQDVANPGTPQGE